MSDLVLPNLADAVIFYDDEKQPNCAFIVHVWPRLSRHIDLPICNLISFTHIGRIGSRQHVEPAYKAANGKWIIINKWAYKGVVPDEEWNYIDSEYMVRRQGVGNGERIDTAPPRYARRIQDRR